MKRRKGLKIIGDNKGVGLLAIWASVIVGLIFLYIAFLFLMPVVGQIVNTIYDVIYTTSIPMNENWQDLFINIASFFQIAFQFMIYAFIISLIIYVVVQSARRRTDAYEEEL